jgi:DNA (cytosine-5)-methyltransferase 1
MPEKNRFPAVLQQTCVTVSPTLRAGGNTTGGDRPPGTDVDTADSLITYGIPGNWIGRSPENGGNATKPMHDIAPCLTKTDQHGVAFAQNSSGEVRFQAGDGSIAGCLSSELGSQQQTYINKRMTVRRLTPRECERLQGFPDDYTKISQKTADGPRYKALGNSMAVPVMRWIGERIVAVDSI